MSPKAFDAISAILFATGSICFFVANVMILWKLTK